MTTLTTGTEVGGYRIEGLLGRGGMGIVYEAIQLSLGRTVALKLLAADLSDNDTFRSRFRREGRLQAALDHAHIVPIYEAGELADEGLFIAMRLIRGSTLKELIRIHGLDAARAMKILIPIADALDTAHEGDLVHRDVKPQNILVGRRDHAYLADFGLTRAPSDTAFTKTGSFVGTLDYISPEQIRGDQATAMSDLYSLAAVAFECLTGTVPFPKPSEASVLYAHMAEPPPRASEVRTQLPAAVDAVLARALAKQPGERYDTALELVMALDEALRSAPTPPAPPPADPSTALGPGFTTEEVVVPRPAADGSTLITPYPGAEPEAPPTAPDVTPSPPAPAPAASSPAAVEPPEGDATVLHERAGAATHADRRRPWNPAPPPDQRASALPAAPVRRRAVLAGALAVGFAAVVGLSIGGAGEAPPTDATPDVKVAPQTLRAGGLTVGIPEGWRATDEAPDVPGLALSDAAALERASGEAAGSVVVGRSEGTGRTLLPGALLARLDAPPAQDEPVALGQARAYRYDALRVDGVDGPVTLYVAPLRKGVATVACVAADDDCPGIAGSLKLSEALEPVALGPRQPYAEAVGGALERLRGATNAAGRALRAADTSGGQARAAGRLQAAYSALERRLKSVRITPLERSLHPRLVRAARRAAAAYGALAAAARNEDGSAYRRARRAAAERETAIRAVLREANRLGYEVR